MVINDHPLPAEASANGETIDSGLTSADTTMATSDERPSKRLKLGSGDVSSHGMTVGNGEPKATIAVESASEPIVAAQVEPSQDHQSTPATEVAPSTIENGASVQSRRSGVAPIKAQYVALNVPSPCIGILKLTSF